VSIEIANESGVEVDEADLAALARYVLDDLRMHPLAELSVLLVDRATMSDLHERWMGEPGPTDVLAFPMDELRPPPPGSGRAEPGGSGDPDEEPGLLGDVVLCPEVAAGQAAQARHELRDELELLCTHGILHLLGYDHAEAAEKATMFGLQDELLRSWRAARDQEPGPGDAPGPGVASPRRRGAAQPGPDAGQPGPDAARRRPATERQDGRG
jgi:probable rRNA maturation factor